jgi:hypothetical protein
LDAIARCETFPHSGENRLDKYWTPFKLALQPQSHGKVKSHAVDALSRLVGHKLLKGSLLVSPETIIKQGENVASNPQSQASQGRLSALTDYLSRSAGFSSKFGDSHLDVLDFSKWDAFIHSEDTLPRLEPTHTLIDQIIHSICTCFPISSNQPPQDAELLHLAVLKVLLTIMTCPSIEVHGASLIKILTTCFHIHVFTKNAILGTTAKASLTQIMNIVLSRMERVALTQVISYLLSKFFAMYG